MKIIIVGDGKVGYSLAERLSQENHDITVIDSSSQVLTESLEMLDIMTVKGNGASLETLREAGAGESDILIATTNADETNLLCCICAKKLGCRNTIARVRNPQYNKQLLFLKEELGLSLVVNPELAAAQEIYRMVQFPTFLKRDSFDKGRVELVELKVSAESRLNGMKICDLSSFLSVHALICAVERKDDVVIPNGSFELKEGDRITVTAARNSLVKLVKSLGLVQHKIKGVMIIGCSRITEYLTEELLNNGVDVKVIEKDYNRCEQFSMRFPSALVINGDASRRGFLKSENIDKTDAVITLTGIDEENLIISMYCNHSGVHKTITKVDRNEYARLFADRDIGSVVCPKDLTANEIIRYVRAVDASGEGSLQALHRIVDDKVEALEFTVTVASNYIGIPLAKLRLRTNMIICCISRRSQVIIPNGDSTIEVGDTVVIITTADRAINDLKDIFERDTAR